MDTILDYSMNSGFKKNFPWLRDLVYLLPPIVHQGHESKSERGKTPTPRPPWRH